MRGYFTDDLLLILPSDTTASVRLFGEVISTHRGPLALAITGQSDQGDEITVDLTGVHYLANSALEILVAVALRLTQPACLVVRATVELDLRGRLAARGWDQINTLRLTDACPPGASRLAWRTSSSSS
ncbi:hypothetical protein [Streptomyces sp. LNU-CPARS28]|uniref:hypothetical protein n=1 Tax=Streptomyces sp. LNU-CPARS28 TaxID=3137371 RepID=UPI003134680C